MRSKEIRMKDRTRRFFALITLSCATAILAVSCVDHTLPEADEFSCASLGEVSFDIDVRPIITSKCAIQGDGGCHNGGNGPSLDFTQFTNIQQRSIGLKDRVTRTPGTSGAMPKIGSLTDDQIRTLVCWVDQGAQNN